MALKHDTLARHKLTTYIAAGAAAGASAIGGYAILDTASSSGVAGGANAARAGTLQGRSARRLTAASTLPDSPGGTARANSEQAITLTDHEQYVKHHERLASLA